MSNNMVEHRTFTKHEHMVMRLCYDLADMSTCKRAKMGAVIAIDEATFITGYNGTVKGFPNECDEESLVCDVCNVTVDENEYKEGDKHCKHGIVIKRPKTIHTVIHAETNAIIRAGRHGIKIEGKTIYMTTSPCVNCANNIIQAGLSRVIFDKYHDDLRGIDILKQAGIEVIKYNTYKK